MKYCTKCGTRLADDAKFCSNCGASQEENSNFSEEHKQENVYVATPSILITLLPLYLEA